LVFVPEELEFEFVWDAPPCVFALFAPFTGWVTCVLCEFDCVEVVFQGCQTNSAIAEAITMTAAMMPKLPDDRALWLSLTITSRFCICFASPILVLAPPLQRRASARLSSSRIPGRFNRAAARETPQKS